MGLLFAAADSRRKNWKDRYNPVSSLTSLRTNVRTPAVYTFYHPGPGAAPASAVLYTVPTGKKFLLSHASLGGTFDGAFDYVYIAPNSGEEIIAAAQYVVAQTTVNKESYFNPPLEYKAGTIISGVQSGALTWQATIAGEEVNDDISKDEEQKDFNFYAISRR